MSERDDEAERAVLGNILLRHGKTFCEAAAELTADDFHQPSHRHIFLAMEDLDGSRTQIDALTVWDKLTSLGTQDTLKHLGGKEYLSRLPSESFTAESPRYHALIVARKARKRQWQDAGRAIASLGEEDDDAFCAEAERIAVSATVAPKNTAAKSQKAVLRQVIADIEEWHDRKAEGGVTGVTTGFKQLDMMTHGYQNANLIITAARPSMGKSAKLNKATEAAANAGVACLVFSLEMSDKQLAQRMVMSDARVDSKRAQAGLLDMHDFTRIHGSMARLADLPIWWDDTGGLPINELMARARRWRMREAKNYQRLFIGVDYLQLVQPRKALREKHHEVAEISRNLKILAKELNCPVNALCQLNRECEKRPNKRPILSDLAQSGSIEQDADVIEFIYRDEVYTGDECKDEDRGVAEIIIGKQRNGPIGVVRAAWLPTYTRFENLAYSESGRR